MTSIVATSLTRKLEYADYAALPDDGRRYEVIDGELWVMAAPSPLHQRVSKRLQRQLEAYFEGRGLGEVFNAPIDLILGSHDVLQPDLMVVLDPAQVSRRAIEGAPALVVETLSPSTRERDAAVKADRYAALGVVHYWLVDPEARRIECRRLESGAYTPAVEGQGDAVLTAPGWPDLTVDLTALWC